MPLYISNLKPEKEVDDFYYYFRNMVKRINSLRTCDSKIKFDENVVIETKSKYYYNLDKLIFYIERINMLLEESIIVVPQSNKYKKP